MTERNEVDAPATTAEETGVEPAERSIVWGASLPLGAGVVEVPVDGRTVRVERLAETVLRVAESEAAPFLVALREPGGVLRLGVVRRRRPVLLRLPRPVRLAAGATLTLYTTYAPRPALFYEGPSGERVKLVEPGGAAVKKTYYGEPGSGLLCELHEGPLALDPAELVAPPSAAVVCLRLRNRSGESVKAGIVLVDPPVLDFYVSGERLCLNVIELQVLSRLEGDLVYHREPSLPGALLLDERVRETSTGLVLELLRELVRDRVMTQGV